jgi:hypothetical protein
MRFLLGIGLLAATSGLVWLLRPREGRERLIVRFPGAWIVVGLLLTGSVATAVALIATGLGG